MSHGPVNHKTVISVEFNPEQLLQLLQDVAAIKAQTEDLPQIRDRQRALENASARLAGLSLGVSVCTTMLANIAVFLWNHRKSWGLFLI